VADAAAGIGAAVAAATRDAPSLAALGGALVEALGGRIPFDRLNIGLIDQAHYMFFDAYVHGHNVAGRTRGHLRTLDGTVVEAAIRAGDGFAFGHADRDAWLARFPRFGPVYDSGIRAMLAVPVRDGGGVVGALVLAARDPSAYPDAALGNARAAAQAIAPRLLALRPVSH
jgi:GAF domain-containing protein